MIYFSKVETKQKRYWQSLTWYRTTKNRIKLQQLNKVQLHCKGPKPVAKTAETGNSCSWLVLLPPPRPDSAAQDPRQGLSVAFLPSTLPVSTPGHILSSRKPWHTGSSEAWQAQQTNSKKLQGPAHSLHRDFWAGGLPWFWQSCWVPSRECQ